MRVPQEQLIITFHSTTEAIQMERFCKQHQIAGRMIPVPQAISAGCGLAWKADPQQKESLQKVLVEAGIAWNQMHII